MSGFGINTRFDTAALPHDAFAHQEQPPPYLQNPQLLCEESLPSQQAKEIDLLKKIKSLPLPSDEPSKLLAFASDLVAYGQLVANKRHVKGDALFKPQAELGLREARVAQSQLLSSSADTLPALKILGKAKSEIMHANNSAYLEHCAPPLKVPASLRYEPHQPTRARAGSSVPDLKEIDFDSPPVTPQAAMRQKAREFSVLSAGDKTQPGSMTTLLKAAAAYKDAADRCLQAAQSSGTHDDTALKALSDHLGQLSIDLSILEMKTSLFALHVDIFKADVDTGIRLLDRLR